MRLLEFKERQVAYIEFAIMKMQLKLSAVALSWGIATFLLQGRLAIFVE